MRQTFLGAAAVAVALGLASAGLMAQKTTQIHPGRGGSPHVKTEWAIDGAAIAIEYGRPSAKGRTDSALMPPGQPWRAGADEATQITVDKPLNFGAVKLAPGRYSLNTLPGATWQLLIGVVESPGQWGVPYNQSLERHRAPMRIGKTEKPVEQLTFTITDTPAGGTLHLEWANTRASIDFTIG